MEDIGRDKGCRYMGVETWLDLRVAHGCPILVLSRRHETAWVGVWTVAMLVKRTSYSQVSGHRNYLQKIIVICDKLQGNHTVSRSHKATRKDLSVSISPPYTKGSNRLFTTRT